MQHKILIVDDEEMIRSVLRTKMELEGYTVVEAEDGEKALRQLEKEEFDLVISDIMMPNSDGLELIIRMRKERPAIPVIAMSSPHNQLFLDSARALGGLGELQVIEKPFRLEEIARRVEVLLETPAALRPTL